MKKMTKITLEDEVKAIVSKVNQEGMREDKLVVLIYDNVSLLIERLSAVPYDKDKANKLLRFFIEEYVKFAWDLFRQGKANDFSTRVKFFELSFRLELKGKDIEINWASIFVEHLKKCCFDDKSGINTDTLLLDMLKEFAKLAKTNENKISEQFIKELRLSSFQDKINAFTAIVVIGEANQQWLHDFLDDLLQCEWPSSWDYQDVLQIMQVLHIVKMDDKFVKLFVELLDKLVDLAPLTLPAVVKGTNETPTFFDCTKKLNAIDVVRPELKLIDRFIDKLHKWIWQWDYRMPRDEDVKLQKSMTGREVKPEDLENFQKLKQYFVKNVENVDNVDWILQKHEKFVENNGNAVLSQLFVTLFLNFTELKKIGHIATFINCIYAKDQQLGEQFARVVFLRDHLQNHRLMSLSLSPENEQQVKDFCTLVLNIRKSSEDKQLYKSIVKKLTITMGAREAIALFNGLYKIDPEIALDFFNHKITAFHWKSQDILTIIDMLNQNGDKSFRDTFIEAVLGRAYVVPEGSKEQRTLLLILMFCIDNYNELCVSKQGKRDKQDSATAFIREFIKKIWPIYGEQILQLFAEKNNTYEISKLLLADVARILMDNSVIVNDVIFPKPNPKLKSKAKTEDAVANVFRDKLSKFVSGFAVLFKNILITELKTELKRIKDLQEESEYITDFKPIGDGDKAIDIFCKKIQELSKLWKLDSSKFITDFLLEENKSGLLTMDNFKAVVQSMTCNLPDVMKKVKDNSKTQYLILEQQKSLIEHVNKAMTAIQIFFEKHKNNDEQKQNIINIKLDRLIQFKSSLDQYIDRSSRQDIVDYKKIFDVCSMCKGNPNLRKEMFKEVADIFKFGFMGSKEEDYNYRHNTDGDKDLNKQFDGYIEHPENLTPPVIINILNVFYKSIEELLRLYSKKVDLQPVQTAIKNLEEILKSMPQKNLPFKPPM
jgi:hypothetical protein